MPQFRFLVLALLLAGCATFNKTEIAQLRQSGLRPDLMDKLEHRRALEPEEIIELKRARVSDALVIRHLDNVGVNYILSRPDIARLLKAGVSQRVMDALAFASSRFMADATYRNAYVDPYFFYDPWYPGLYGAWTVGIGVDHWHGGGHHRHHR